MAQDEGLNERVREILEGAPRISEKAMFGGLAFLCGGNLFLGVRAERLMVRVGVERYTEALALSNVRPMERRGTGRGMTGYVWIDAPAFDEDDDLRRFVEWGLGVASQLPVKPLNTKPASSKSKLTTKPKTTKR